MTELIKNLGRWTQLPWRMGLIVLGISFVAASAFSTILAKLFLPDDAKPVARSIAQQSNITVPNPTASLNQPAIDLIIKRNIFNSEGKTGDDSAPAEEGNLQPSAEAVKSDLPVKLLGTIYGGDPYSGIAMIENSAKRTVNSFLVGDTLVKDAVIREILRERIIIDRGGRREYLEVAPTELARNRRNKKKAAPTSGSQGVTPIATEPPPSTFKEEGFERKERDISMTEAYRNKLLTTDFTKVLQDAKATPNMVDGQLQGFVLNRIRKDSIYEKAGLQNDDIVEEINGVPLTDTSQSIRLLQSLRNEKEIEVRINRGGRTQRFTLSIN